MKNSSGISLRASQEQSIIRNSCGEFSLSTYTDKPVDIKELSVQMAKLKMAFPRMESGFFNLLAERIMDNKFTSERLRDAVNYLMDNFQYKELNISDIIKFDRRVKLYTYLEVSELATQGKAYWSDFEIRKIGGECFRVKKADLHGKS